MAKCSAYIRAGRSPHAWKPCVRRALRGHKYCRIHGDAVLGAVLGLLVKDFPERCGRRITRAVKWFAIGAAAGAVAAKAAH
jgi:hypothetical protein